MKKILVLFGILFYLVTGVNALADIIDLNTLHVFCTSGTCTDNGTITPTTTNPPAFGFTRSPDSNSGLTTPTITLEFLIPNNESVTFGTVTGSGTGIATPVTPAIFSNTAWTTGDLTNYLGLTQTGGPNNPIGAFLISGVTLGVDSGATGYFVYQADFGSVNFGSPDPTFTTGVTFPLGTVILAFVEGSAPNTVQDATANSGALLITNHRVPEPISLILLGCGLVGAGLYRRFRKP